MKIHYSCQLLKSLYLLYRSKRHFLLLFWSGHCIFGVLCLFLRMFVPLPTCCCAILCRFLTMFYSMLSLALVPAISGSYFIYPSLVQRVPGSSSFLLSPVLSCYLPPLFSWLLLFCLAARCSVTTIILFLIYTFIWSSILSLLSPV